MKIEINLSAQDARLWEYFLRKRFQSQAGLPRLVRMAALEAVAETARADAAEAMKAAPLPATDSEASK